MILLIKAINSFVSLLEFFYKYLALFFIFASVLLGILRVAGRHLGLPGASIIAELAIVALTWAVLMGIAWQVSTAGHLRITVIYEKVPLLGKRLLSLVFALFISYVGYLMLHEGLIYVQSTRLSSAMATSLKVPRWITFYLPLPIAGFGVFVFGLRQIIKTFNWSTK
jgi:TRAP-type C4-dicarboxylate transport system permease small subunit